MPTAPKAHCRVPRCPGLATVRGYCAQHNPDRLRPSAARRGYTQDWRQARLQHLALHPYCQAKGCTCLATDVHHIATVREAPERVYDPANLVSLCHAHHSEVTAREQSGWGSRGAA